MPFEYISPIAIDPEDEDFIIAMTSDNEEVDANFVANEDKSFTLSFETDELDQGSYKFTFSLNDSKSLSVLNFTLEVVVYNKFIPPPFVVVKPKEIKFNETI